MPVSDSHPDFTSWKRKDTHRPLLRMPLTFPSSSNMSSDNKVRLGVEKKSSAPPSSSSAAAAASDASLSSTPSLDGRKLKTRKIAPAVLEEKEEASSDDVVASQQSRSRDTQPKTSLAESVSVTASEQLMRERLRLLEEDADEEEEQHETQRRSLRARRGHATVLSGSSHGSSSRDSRDARSMTSLNSPASSADVRGNQMSRSEECKANTLHTASGAAAGSNHSNYRPHQTPLSSMQTSLTSSQPPSRQPTGLNGTKQFHVTAAASPQEDRPFSPPAKQPVVDPSREENAAAMPREVVSRSPLPLPPQPQLSQPPPQQQQQLEHAGSPSFVSDFFQRCLDELRHDVQNCAHEIEQLVEDQYDLRCSVRDTLLEAHRTEASMHAVAAASSSKPPQPSAQQQQQQQQQQRQQQRATIPQTSENDGSYGSRSCPSNLPVDSASASVPPSPPSWLLPWLEQLRREQSENLQRLREETVVLVCHAVAELHHAVRQPQRSSEEQCSQSQPAPPSATANPVVKVGPQSLLHDDHADEPPASLLWQRYRRLMSPTPPQRSSVASAASEASSLVSLRGQDALWSALVQMQRVMETQSTQIAQLMERVAPPPALPIAQTVALPARSQPQHRIHGRHLKEHRHECSCRQRGPREASVTSSDMAATASTTTTSKSATAVHTSTGTRSRQSSDSSSATPRRQAQRHGHRSSSHNGGKRTSSRMQSTAHHSHHHPCPPPLSSSSSASSSPNKAERHRTRQLDAIQGQVSDLRQLLRETLQHDRQLAQQAAPQREMLSSKDSDAGSSKYVQRRYVAANHVLPARPCDHARESYNGDARPHTNAHAAQRSPPTEDTRYARGTPPWHMPSPSASPIHEEWVDEGVYAGTASPSIAEAREVKVLHTPPQLPRQRVRTVLTSSLVYPH